MNEKAKILIFSDIHYSKDSLPEEKRWYPGFVKFLEFFSKRLASRFLRFCDNYTQKHFQEFLEYIKDKKYDAVVCLGDMTPGVTGSGLITGKSQREALEFKTQVEKAISPPIHYVFGNHDLGYFSLAGYKNGGSSKKAITIARKIYGAKPFYSFEVGDYKFIVLTDTLITSKNKEFEELRNQQFDFLRKELAKNSRVFLLLHGPFALNNKKLKKIIRENHKKVEAVFCGHAHSSLIKYFVGPAFPFPQKLVMTPSVIGFFGFLSFTRGFTELTLGNPSYKWKHKGF